MSTVLETPLKKIKSQVLAFYDRFSAIADYLAKASIENPEDEDLKKLLVKKEDFLLQFYIDRESLQKINTLMEHSVNDHILVLFGMHTYEEDTVKKEKPTACFLAMGENNSISDIHRTITGQTAGTLSDIPGQQTWPPPPYPDGSGLRNIAPSNSYSLASNRTDLEAFLRYELS